MYSQSRVDKVQFPRAALAPPLHAELELLIHFHDCELRTEGRNYTKGAILR